MPKRKNTMLSDASSGATRATSDANQSPTIQSPNSPSFERVTRSRVNGQVARTEASRDALLAVSDLGHRPIDDLLRGITPPSGSAVGSRARVQGTQSPPRDPEELAAELDEMERAERQRLEQQRASSSGLSSRGRRGVLHSQRQQPPSHRSSQPVNGIRDTEGVDGNDHNARQQEPPPTGRVRPTSRSGPQDPPSRPNT